MQEITQNKNIYDIIIEKLTKEWYYSMLNNISQTKWEVPRYSKKQIDKAGKIISSLNSLSLRDIDISLEDIKNATDILNNWRSAHAYPLQIIASNLRRNNPNAIVVQRLKRFDSIAGKLIRFPDMSLYRMQDLGGCRVIVDSIDQVYESLNQYKKSRIRHILRKENDYIQNPKLSGYRSYHMVYQFHSDDKDTYNKNIMIEIQFRTQLQHIWATAVEMMGLYTKNNLKSSQGNQDILRFFALVSSLFAIKEDMPVCPNTSGWADELINEIIQIDKKNNIIMKLKAINQAAQITEYNENFYLKNGYYLLVLNYDEPSLNIYPFKQSDFELAANVYNKMELEFIGRIDAVLVSVKSFNILKAAYPNYFIDISEFLNVLKEVIFNYSQYNENIKSFLNSNYLLEDSIPVG